MNKTLGIVVGIVVVVLAVILLTGNMANDEVTTPVDDDVRVENEDAEAATQDRADTDEDSSQTGDATVVRYTDSGFEPQTVTIERGQAVLFVDEASGDMWVASAMHPTHEVYSGTTLREHCNSGAEAFDQCGTGEEYNFIFTKQGEWRYHNHVNASHTGTVIVE